MNKRVVSFWTLLFAAALLRFVFSLDGKIPDAGECLRENVKGTGIVEEEPQRKDTGQIIIVSAQEMKLSGSGGEVSCADKIKIRLKAKLFPEVRYGDSIFFEGKLFEPLNFQSQNGRSFDYEGYLAKDEIYYEIKSAKISLVSGQEMKARTLQEKTVSLLYFLKRGFVRNLKMVLGEPHAALAAGLVVGEKSALGADLLDDFRRVGLIHIVVLSGYNITIVGDAMRRVLSFLPRVWGITTGGFGIALFGIMVGGGATVVRSCLMAAVALFADMIRKDYNVTRALLLAALLMLIQNPDILLHDPSFQLSFLATLGLILLAGPLERRLVIIPERFGMRGIVASTLATQIFISPFILFTMGQLSLIGMIVNILVLPVVPITMLLVFLAGVSGFIFPLLSQAFGMAAHAALSYELYLVRVFSDLPFASFEVPAFPAYVPVVFYIFFFLIYWRKEIAQLFLVLWKRGKDFPRFFSNSG